MIDIQNEVMTNNTLEVINMDHQSLISFLKSYSTLVIRKQKLDYLIEATSKKIDQERELTFKKLDDKMLRIHESRSSVPQDKLTRKLSYIENTYFNKDSINFIKLYLISLLLVCIYYTPRLIVDIFFQDQFNNIAIAFYSAILVVPVFFLHPLLSRIFSTIFEMILNSKQRLKSLTSPQNPHIITLDKIKEINNYDSIKKSIEDKYLKLKENHINDLEESINKISYEISLKEQSLPKITGFNNTNELIIMSDAVIQGRAENWSEALIVLSKELKHQETLKQFDYIARTSKKIIDNYNQLEGSLKELQYEIKNKNQQLHNSINYLNKDFHDQFDSISF